MRAFQRTRAVRASIAQTSGLSPRRVLVLAVLWLLGMSAEAAAQGGAAQPLEPVAAKARAVLETHCARCHQSEKLIVPAPAADLGDILDLARIASDPSLVTPGNADGSPLYTLMLRGLMPSDLANGAKDQAPTSAEIDAVRDWIEALPKTDQGCPNTSIDLPGRLSNALKAEDGRSDVRLIYLGHLRRTCTSDAPLRNYAQAVSKAINSVASAARPVKLEPVAEAAGLYRIHLVDIGISEAQWAKLVGGHRHTILPSAAATAVRGDWLVNRLWRPETYYELTGVPEKLDDHLRLLGVDRQTSQSAAGYRRIGLRSSQVTRGNRLIEYHPNNGSSVWVVYDVAGGEGARDISVNPLPPAGNGGAALTFKADGVQVIATRPNGFLSYAGFDAEGRRIASIAAEVGADTASGVSTSVPGSCMSCHAGGVKPAADQLRDGLASSSSTLPKSLQETLLSQHLTEAETRQLFAVEGLRNRHAFAAAGIDADLRIDGIEIIAALLREHLRPVSLLRAVTELGLERAELERQLDSLANGSRHLGQRLRRGSISRADAEQLYAVLSGSDSVAPVSPAGTQRKSGPELALLADKAAYRTGELTTLSARANVACNLTVIAINPAGKATVIFPNDFETDNALQPDTERIIPSASAGYRLRLNDRGRERFVGICTTQSRLPFGIQQNFELQRFTALGDWRNFLRALVDGVDSDQKAEKPESRSRARGVALRSKPKEAEAPKRSRSEPEARASIDILVE